MKIKVAMLLRSLSQTLQLWTCLAATSQTTESERSALQFTL
ncbi:hypothetical protein RchiOBHm_Chr4g0404561 [Rosa chinensis]|uniref:Uncharacterized protein n=1 Tax=Rosa chinensis TaxID=74649 RepID=A0A2P6QTU2_ROSCH|nr:hypothetical protein RchiOBHm_Chr4g0404561 [Rosa chinensis]